MKRAPQVRPLEGPAKGAVRHTPWIIAGTAICFHAAFLTPTAGLPMAGFLGCLYALRRIGSARRAFYLHAGIGIVCYVPHLFFLWNIFQAAAIPLWLILPFWLGIHGLLTWHLHRRLHSRLAVWLSAVLWTGIEYFRCEIWWLRFSWLSSGEAVHAALQGVGNYALGFVSSLAGARLALAFEACGSGPRHADVAAWLKASGKALLAPAAVTACLLLAPMAWHAHSTAGKPVAVAGLQLEFPSHPEILAGLERIRTNHPATELIVLPEYVFDGPPPKVIRDWCRRHGKWLMAGGRDDLEASGPAPTAGRLAPSGWLPSRSSSGRLFRNTAFVVSTNGEIVFRQAKAQPIQFFDDGLPAISQRPWDSPWGRIGVAICYDASFRRVTDTLVRMGAQALVFPTMDVAEWGDHEHRLNARQAKLRAAGYGIPVLRVASSGPSMLVDRSGGVVSGTGMPGQGEILSGELRPAPTGLVPFDALLAPACTWASALVVVVLPWIRLGPPPARPVESAP